MSLKTGIQWCDSTVNPTMGCDGCELWKVLGVKDPAEWVRKCYAGRLHLRFGGHTKGYAPTFEEVTTFAGRMEDAAKWRDLSGTDRPDSPWLNRLPRLTFVSDMSDSLSKDITFDYLKAEIIDNVLTEKGRRHRWLWLTKRPGRMATFSKWLKERRIDWPSNLWAGTSVTTQTTASRVPQLLEVGNDDTVRFLSVEPQWESIDVSKWLPQLDWVIQGGESGNPATPFQIEWARELLRQCREQKVAYFLKQLGSHVTRNGERLEFDDAHAGDWSEWPRDLRVRQFPIRPPRRSRTSQRRSQANATRGRGRRTGTQSAGRRNRA